MYLLIYICIALLREFLMLFGHKASQEIMILTIEPLQESRWIQRSNIISQCFHLDIDQQTTTLHMCYRLKPSNEEDYPDRVHATHDPINTGPLGAKNSTYANLYKNPDGSNDPILHYRPKRCIEPVGPNVPWISHTQYIHDRKKCYLYDCAEHRV
ncbi:MAG: hypothetical protein EZS28_000261 [Streblomastix strix]|uniref:Uncharacterized protein n=1 Tax=Streblomastix strix TaxID=222440 RepID=A0A5J4XAJ2_9EUKA|nr:MAG: hypothetical protein EZS28_000261 [Streblomastix strix]